ncbi:MAG: hypothetical protein RLZZ293_1443 [Pseudomonadota bacterium]|jgi:membrane-associated phospholipid phosphatase
MQKFTLFILFILGSIIVLTLSPLLDQQLAILPYNSYTHQFYGEGAWWCRIIYYAVSLVSICLVATPLIYWWCNRNNVAKQFLVRRMIFITYLSLAIGPGLVVNASFKQNWGRARPYQVIRDHHQFTLPWQPQFNQPLYNSFPSGHVSIGAFIGIPFLAIRRRRLGVGLCVAGFIIVGLVRYLQGGHYFSDICLAALIVWMVNLLVTHLVDKYFLVKWK